MSRMRPNFPHFWLAPYGGAGGASLTDCSVIDSFLADSAVTTVKLNDCSVDSSKLLDSAVSTDGLQDCSVTTVKINNAAVDSDKLLDSSVSADILQDSAVTTNKILDSSVTYAKIQAVTAARLLGRYDAAAGVTQEIALGANLSFDSDAGTLVAAGASLADCGVLTQHLKDSAVTTVKILDSAVDSSKLADSAVSSAGIQDGTIVSADMADCAVTDSKLADSAVVTTKINNTAVTYAKIQDVTSQRLLGRFDDTASGVTQEIAVGGGLSWDTVNTLLVSDTAISDCTVTNAMIADSAIDSSKLADCAVTYNAIQNVTAQRLLGRWDAAAGSPQEVSLSAELRFDSGNDWMEIADCGVTASLIKDSTITATQMADSAIDSSKLADSAVTSAGIADGTIVEADLADSAVTNAKIADSAIDSGSILDGAVSYQNIQDVNGARILGRFSSDSGAPQEVALSAELRMDSGNDWLEVADCGITASLIKDSTITVTQMADSAIDSSKLADSAVTSAGIADGAIVSADMADCAVINAKIGDTAVQTAQLSDCAVTYAKVQNVTAARLLGRYDATAAGTIQEVALGTNLSFDSATGVINADTGAGLGDCEVIDSRLADSAVITVKINNGAVTASKLADTNALNRIIEIIVTDTTLATGDGKAAFNIPAQMDSWDLIDADAAVDTNTSGTVGPTFQIRNATQSADMLSTKITIDTSEVTSYTATTAPVIDTANDSVVAGDRIEIDIDSAGTAEGLRIITVWQKF